jgi:hypothetical protein
MFIDLPAAGGKVERDMGDRPVSASAFLGVLLFLGFNYLIGFLIGMWLTASPVAATVIAFLTPCLSLLGIALLGPAPAMPGRHIEG